MADDLLAQLRPPGGWGSDHAPGRDPVEAPARVERTAKADEERWLLACVARGHVRWRGDGIRRIASRSCAHTDEHTDVTDQVTWLISAGHAQRSGGNQGGIHLTPAGRRRLTALERSDDG